MVACADHSVAINCWVICNLCRLSNSTIYIHFILMKNTFKIFKEYLTMKRIKSRDWQWICLVICTVAFILIFL